MRARILILLLALAGCATQAGFDQRMQALVGLPVGDLVQSVGVPDSDYTTPDGRRFLQYERLGTAAPTAVPAFGIGFGGFGWRGGYGGGLGLGTGYTAYAPPPPCRVTFEIRADRVIAYTRAGNGCIAQPPGD